MPEGREYRLTWPLAISDNQELADMMNFVVFDGTAPRAPSLHGAGVESLQRAATSLSGPKSWGIRGPPSMNYLRDRNGRHAEAGERTGSKRQFGCVHVSALSTQQGRRAPGQDRHCSRRITQTAQCDGVDFDRASPASAPRPKPGNQADMDDGLLKTYSACGHQRLGGQIRHAPKGGYLALRPRTSSGRRVGNHPLGGGTRAGVFRRRKMWSPARHARSAGLARYIRNDTRWVKARNADDQLHLVATANSSSMRRRARIVEITPRRDAWNRR
jgi:hypothetical protein